MSQLPKIIDNRRCKLVGIFNPTAPVYDHISIATGYWDLLGTKLVIDRLKDYKKIRLLIGREPLISCHKTFELEPDYPDKDFFYDLERLQPTVDLKALI